MVNIAVCDDSQSDADRLRRVLAEIAGEKDIKICIDIYNDGDSLIERIERNMSAYDIVFLDMEMDGLDGMETASQIREINDDLHIIFVTAYSEYSLKAYEVHPYFFAVKPVSVENLEKQFNNLLVKVTSNVDKCFVYSFNKQEFRIPIKDIMYFESCKRQIKLYVYSGKEYVFYGTVNDVQKQLWKFKTEFWRIHQSYLINPSYINSKTSRFVVMMNGSKIMISDIGKKEYAKMCIDKVEEKFVD